MQGRNMKGQDTFRVTKASNGTESTKPKLAAVEQPQDAGTSTWIDFNALASGESCKDVRAQAARASAAARRATLAKKQARRGPHPGSLVFALPSTPATTKKAAANSKAILNEVARKLRDQDALRKVSAAEQSYFHDLVGIVTQVLERRPLTLKQPGETSLAHSSIRSMLWTG
ncbi:hypothetical protein LTR49_028792 [Elasticomyces elasticus]|nr:hypothetical protein LTR49_028792 [Elasticomyces elasticus]